MDHPWHISIISTDEDLSDLRSVVIEKLKGTGFEVLAFEESNFPVKPGIHSHDVCLAALKGADIVVLILDKRYGGKYILNKDISITEAEYDTAIKDSKFIIPCVREKSWHEYQAITQQIKRSGLSVIEFQASNTPGTLDCWDTFNFIHKVTHAPHDNFTVFYSTPTDIVEKVFGKLKGLSDHIVRLIVDKLIYSVENIKTTTALSLSLGDVLTKGYFVEPPYKLASGTAPFGCKDITEVILNTLQNHENIAIFGPPGIGKSTLLAKAFLEHARNFVGSQKDEAPIFVKLRGLGSAYHFDVNETINDLLPQLLNKAAYPLLDLQRMKFVFYIDAFDELTEDVSDINVDDLVSKSMFTWPFAITARLHFAISNLEVSSFGDKLRLILKLDNWSPELAIDYIEHFCQSRSREDLIPQFGAHFSGNSSLSELFNNPLLLTLFLLIVEEGDMSLPLDIIDKSTLYSKAIYVWAKRDLNKRSLPKSEDVIQSLIIAWQLIAWSIYKSRLNKNPSTVSDIFDEVSPFLASNTISNYYDVLTTLLDIRPFTNKLVGFIHEELLEFLCAQAILSGFSSQLHPFPQSLHYPIRSEINRFVVGHIRKYNATTSETVLHALVDQYHKASIGTDGINIIIRNQAAYYIGRIDSPSVIDTLLKLEEMETDVSVKLSLEFGLVKNGNLEIEAQLFHKLTTDVTWDRTNRGYHLLYYQDCPISSGPPFLDPEDGSWGRTLKALLSHLKSKSPRHFRLCRIEMYTIKRFIETRSNVGGLTLPDLDLIEANLREVTALLPTYFSQEALTCFYELKGAWTNAMSAH